MFGEREEDYSRKTVKPYKNVATMKPPKRILRFSNSAGEGELIIGSQVQIKEIKVSAWGRIKPRPGGAYNGREVN